MAFQTILLWGIAVVLTALAGVLGFFMFREVVRIMRDVVTNRAPRTDDLYGDVGEPARRITPFRDRGTVERLVDFFRGDRDNNKTGR